MSTLCIGICDAVEIVAKSFNDLNATVAEAESKYEVDTKEGADRDVGDKKVSNSGVVVDISDEKDIIDTCEVEVTVIDC